MINKGFTPHLKSEVINIAGSNRILSAGFTLVEIIIAMAIFTGIVFVVSSFGLDIYDFGIFLGENLTAQQELQLTLRSMISEMRAMTQSVSGAYPIELASQNSIVFYSDTDGDGFTERLHYFLDGNILKRGIIKPIGNPLSYSGAEDIREAVHNIYSPAGNLFGYYDSNYDGTQPELGFPVNIPLIRLVKVKLTVDPNPIDPSSRVNFSTEVNIRNL